LLKDERTKYPGLLLAFSKNTLSHNALTQTTLTQTATRKTP